MLILRDLDTRITVPLFLFEDAPKPAGRLNPVFNFDGQQVVMLTQYASGIRKNIMGDRVGTLEREHDAIMGALAMLMIGC